MTVLFILPKSLLSPRKDLLLYYLYCLCKSVQRSLLFEECSFSKADAKVKTFKHILQIFLEVFFKILFSFKTTLLRKGELRKGCLYRPALKKYFNQRCFLLKAGAKVRTLSHIFQMFSEVFFIFLFKGESFERNHPVKEEKSKDSYSVSVRMSIKRRSRSRKRMQK